jgi:hypothetical protein
MPRTMPTQRVRYEFTVKLPASRAAAYRWATDYRPTDFGVMELQGRRKVRRLAPDLILLTDSFRSDPFNVRAGRRTVKTKLVHLDPGRWRWTATHLSGPAKNSQFLYELTPRGAHASTLRFTGIQVERVTGTPTPASVRRRARVLRDEDSSLWDRLSEGMRRDLASTPR